MKTPLTQSQQIAASALKWIFGLVALGLLVFALTGCTAYPITRQPEKMEFFTVAATGSMYPAFRAGDVAMRIRGEWKDVKIGSVVVRGNCQWSPNQVTHEVFHRIVARTIGGFISQGDNCLEPDPGYMIAQDFGGFVELYSRCPFVIEYRHRTGLRL